MANKKPNDPILNELVSIKKLLILALYGMNFPSDEINKAVSLGSANIRGMFSKKKILKARKNKNEE
jgi:hypothetical protein